MPAFLKAGAQRMLRGLDLPARSPLRREARRRVIVSVLLAAYVRGEAPNPPLVGTGRGGRARIIARSADLFSLRCG